jgi:hypothetical protein
MRSNKYNVIHYMSLETRPRVPPRTYCIRFFIFEYRTCFYSGRFSIILIWGKNIFKYLFFPTSSRSLTKRDERQSGGIRKDSLAQSHCETHAWQLSSVQKMIKRVSLLYERKR